MVLENFIEQKMLHLYYAPYNNKILDELKSIYKK